MLLATMFHKPYGYSPADVSIARENNRRFTMRDIGAIEKRVDQLEYYLSLIHISEPTRLRRIS